MQKKKPAVEVSHFGHSIAYRVLAENTTVELGQFRA